MVVLGHDFLCLHRFQVEDGYSLLSRYYANSIRQYAFFLHITSALLLRTMPLHAKKLNSLVSVNELERCAVFCTAIPGSCWALYCTFPVCYIESCVIRLMPSLLVKYFRSLSQAP